MSSFVHLHTHSHYSLLNALPTIRELVEAAKADGMEALALTDNGNLYGAVEFYQTCKKEGVKPIIGIDAYLAPRTRHDRDASIDTPRARIVLLAKNTDGYKNLIKLVTESYVNGFYYRPRLDHELIEQYKNGLVCIIPSFAGETSHALQAGDTEKAHALIAWYKAQFGDDCYLEITHHPEIPGHRQLQDQIKTLAKHTQTPLVAAHDVYYLKPEDRLARETMVKIQTGGIVETTGGFDEHEEDFSFISQAQAEQYFKDIPEALENSLAIANACNVEIEIGTWYFPDYIIESGRSPDEELAALSKAGIAWRGLNPKDPVITERIAYELEIIKMKGYAKYFLVVGDLLREARKRKILTTIRGSVAGSLVTYVLGITNVNPIEYKLPFERFLNPERPSAPDIDMDYADSRRDEIIGYAKEKYGTDKVAQIGTFGKMLARAVVRDVARALNHPYATGDRIAKLIPMGSQGFPMTIDRALALEPDLKELYTKDAETREIIDLAKKIEGRARHVGVHAAGVVIAPAPLTDFVPLQYEPKSDKGHGGNLITQYDMHTVGEDGVGLLKFDFLGIKNLSILADAVDRVRAIRGMEIDIENIPLDDTNTFEMLASGQTMGLFQLNGSGMTHFLKDLRPSSIDDINAMVALYRPGPMESIPQYIERKHNPHLITYLDPRLEKILDRSYGVVTYQDDVLMIARELAGYSWLEADLLRKAMGKKIPKVMAAEKEKLLLGFVTHGKLSRSVAERLWQLIEPFAAYGFNKCLPASSRVIDAESGVPTTIGNLLGRKKSIRVYALSADQKIIEIAASGPFENGIKAVYRLTTRSGRVIRATGNHPLYTWTGWTELLKLKAGMRVAVPRRLPAPQHAVPLAPHEAVALGYLIAEGNLCHPHGVYFYSTQEDELQDFICAAQQFSNTKVTIDRSKRCVSVYVGAEKRGAKNSLFAWINTLDLHGKRAIQKYVPDTIFSADNASIACFLGKLWQGDGTVSIDNYQAFYATSSRRLADDVQHLLLRFGIVSTIHTKSFRYRGGFKQGWTIVVSGQKNLAQFREHIGRHLIGKKRVALETLAQECAVRTNT
ncbi:MAG: DNA polymerase III subunit alpha, partial [Patescibacteria group bacterium]|nr:DNA polymerase III subunit alpha [Patescibacteria group bacterium]